MSIQFEIFEATLKIFCLPSFWFALTSLGVFLAYNDYRNRLIISGKKHKPNKVMFIIVFLIVIVAFISIIGNDFLYYVDNKKAHIEEAIIVPKTVSSTNRGLYFIDENSDKYRTYSHDDEISNALREYYVGHACKVEYFKRSKVVRRIAVIE